MLHAEQIREYALSFSEVTEGFPFGEAVLVFKVKGKVFLLVSLDEIPLQFNVKCDPEQAVELRERYPEVILPGYHMNKKHWNTLIVDGKLTNDFLKSQIEHSYHLVKGKAKK
jgi:predicted DNA-binding protein (MmcQ/YjbR family)